MFGVCVAVAASVLPPPGGDDRPVRVTVVVVLGTTRNNVVDPVLTNLAKEVQKRDDRLTGFKLVATAARSIRVGESATFPLVDRQELKVKAEKAKDAAGRIGLTITPPGLGEVTYACACDKYFPVVTPHRTAAGEALILAVMAKPCTQKK
jgi:hypothetical protein